MTIVKQLGGYRDPLKALSVKALEARQKAAADAAAQATQLQQPIADPWQGASHIAGVLAGGLNEARADAAAADARNRLAEIKAGIDWTKGPTAEQIGELSTLDSELADKLGMKAYEEAIASRGREDEQAFTAGESQLTREQQRTLQEDQQKAAADLQEDTQTHQVGTAKTLAETQSAEQQRQEAAASAEQQRKEAATAAAEERKRLATPSSEDAKIYDDWENGQFGDPQSPAAIAARDAAIAEAHHHDPLKPGDMLSPGEAEIDKKFAPEVLDWKTVGGPNAVKATTQTRKAIELLQTKPGITGFSAAVADLDPTGVFSKWYNPDGTVARDAIRETVQMTLRPILGAQFTQQEGEALMNRAFDINLGPEENIRRAKLVLEQVEGIAANKQAMVDYFDQNRTLKGFAGGPADYNALKTLFTEDEQAGGGGGGGGEEYQEGEIVEDDKGNKMILQNGQWVPYNG